MKPTKLLLFFLGLLLLAAIVLWVSIRPDSPTSLNRRILINLKTESARTVPGSAVLVAVLSLPADTRPPCSGYVALLGSTYEREEDGAHKEGGFILNDVPHPSTFPYVVEAQQVHNVLGLRPYREWAHRLHTGRDVFEVMANDSLVVHTVDNWVQLRHEYRGGYEILEDHHHGAIRVHNCTSRSTQFFFPQTLQTNLFHTSPRVVEKGQTLLINYATLGDPWHGPRGTLNRSWDKDPTVLAVNLGEPASEPVKRPGRVLCAAADAGLLVVQDNERREGKTTWSALYVDLRNEDRVVAMWEAETAPEDWRARESAWREECVMSASGRFVAYTHRFPGEIPQASPEFGIRTFDAHSGTRDYVHGPTGTQVMEASPLRLLSLDDDGVLIWNAADTAERVGGNLVRHMTVTKIGSSTTR